jgi:N-acetylglutamate synthase-like GNAT family acetyltransferase
MDTEDIWVHRARPQDAPRLADFLARSCAGQTDISLQAVEERLGTTGFLLAETSSVLLGYLGWQAENLVARVTDLLVYPASNCRPVCGALLAEMESGALELQCEAAMLFTPREQSLSSAEIRFFESCGYVLQRVCDLSKAWLDAAREIRADDEMVLVKQLRCDRVIRPL